LDQNPLDIIGPISSSQVYLDYRRAFSGLTSLPLVIRPDAILNLAMIGHEHANPFCRLVADSDPMRATCVKFQEQIDEGGGSRTTTITCFAGLSYTAVPVRLGDRVIAFLETGQVALQELSHRHFENIAKQLLDLGDRVDPVHLREAYFSLVVLEPSQYTSMIKMLETFASHLSLVANQITLQKTVAELPLVQRAKAYISERQAEPISSSGVAKAMNVSPFYFCKLFKKATGLTFVDYLGRARVEKAKTELLNPNRRVSEIAYDIGFASLANFNRVFKQVAGQSPSRFRSSSSASLSRQPIIFRRRSLEF
jgi:AraC-like DNA-binding protein/ligand-binding sensor protein